MTLALNWLRTIVFHIVFYGLSVVIVLLSPLVALLGEGPLRWWVVFWTRFHRWCARWIMGIRVVVSGDVPTGPALYAGKHQAFFETFEMVCLLDAPVVVLKKELARIPLWGWTAQRYGMIVVDREGSSGALRQLMRDAAAAAEKGRSVVIFPEGTRTPPGSAPPLKTGFIGLYRALKLPLVPVAIDSGLVWPKSGIKRAGVIHFDFKTPIPPGRDRDTVVAEVYAGINAREPAAEGE